MKRNILFIALLFVSALGYAQENNNVTNPQIAPLSPNVAALTQYVDYPVSHYAGLPNISIPLYEIKCDGVTIPLTLSYHASGIQVAQEASWVGLGWNLSSGGAISRSIKCADDFMYQANYPMMNGYYDGAEVYGNHISPFGVTYYGNYDFYSFGNPGGRPELKTDSEPDIFFLSLPNSSNKFLIDKHRGAVLFDIDNNVKIEIFGKEGNNSHHYFVVTTMDGAKYYFDIFEETTSYSSSHKFNRNFTDNNNLDCDVGYVNENTSTTYVSSWYLSKIITPNQREIDFTYTLIPEQIITPVQESCKKYTEFGYYNQSRGGEYIEGWYWGERYSCSKLKQKTFRLTNIKWDGGSVEFVPFGDNRYDLNGTAKYLDKIIVRDKNNAFVKGFVFNYDYFNADKLMEKNRYVYLRLKLNGVKEYFETTNTNPNNGYRFYYYDGSMPVKNSKNTDYWGYNNGSNYGAKYYAAVYDNETLLDGAIKNSNFDYLKIGMLREMKLPTGGTTQFIYEENEFGQPVAPPKMGKDEYLSVFNQYVSVEFEPGRFPSSDSHIFTISGSHYVDVYFYAESYASMDTNFSFGGGGTPIGKLTQLSGYQSFPTQYVYLPIDFYQAYNGVYWDTKTYKLPPGTYKFEACTPPTDVLVNWTLKNTNNYSQYEYKGAGLRIAQIITDGKVRNFKYTGGKLLIAPVLFYYDNVKWTGAPFGENPMCIAQLSESKLPSSTLSNGYSIGYDKVVESVTDGNQTSKTEYTFFNDIEEELMEEVPFAAPTEPDFYNGLPISIKHFANDTLVQENAFQYHAGVSHPVYAFIYSMNFFMAYDYTYQMIWVKKTKETTTTYMADNQIKRETDYTYNSNFLLSSSTTTLSDGEEYMKKFKYVTDYIMRPSPGPTDNLVFYYMITRNQIGRLSEEQTLIKKDGNWNLINGTFIKYGGNDNTINDNTVIRPKEEYVLETDQPLASYTTSELAGPGILNFDSHYKKRIVYNHYDSYGNPVYFTKDSTENTVYLWGCNSLYPIAEIKNASYSEVCIKIGNSNEQTGKTALETIAAKDAPTDEDMTTINSLRNTLPSAQVTTYTYKPLIGISTMTDPRGITIYYEYDDFGRLKTVKDENNKIINDYDYHYKN